MNPVQSDSTCNHIQPDSTFNHIQPDEPFQLESPGLPLPTNLVKEETSKVTECSENIANSEKSISPKKAFFNKVFVVGRRENVNLLSDCKIKTKMIYYSWDIGDNWKIGRMLDKLGVITENSICCLLFDIAVITQSQESERCIKHSCEDRQLVSSLNFTSADMQTFVFDAMQNVAKFVKELSAHIPVIVAPLVPMRMFCDNVDFQNHRISHSIFNMGFCVLNGSQNIWQSAFQYLTSSWKSLLTITNKQYDSGNYMSSFAEENKDVFSILNYVSEFLEDWTKQDEWREFMKCFMFSLTLDEMYSNDLERDASASRVKEVEVDPRSEYFDRISRSPSFSPNERVNVENLPNERVRKQRIPHLRSRSRSSSYRLMRSRSSSQQLSRRSRSSRHNRSLRRSRSASQKTFRRSRLSSPRAVRSSKPVSPRLIRISRLTNSRCIVNSRSSSPRHFERTRLLSPRLIRRSRSTSPRPIRRSRSFSSDGPFKTQICSERSVSPNQKRRLKSTNYYRRSRSKSTSHHRQQTSSSHHRRSRSKSSSSYRKRKTTLGHKRSRSKSSNCHRSQSSSHYEIKTSGSHRRSRSKSSSRHRSHSSSHHESKISESHKISRSKSSSRHKSQSSSHYKITTSGSHRKSRSKSSSRLRSQSSSHHESKISESHNISRSKSSSRHRSQSSSHPKIKTSGSQRRSRSKSSSRNRSQSASHHKSKISKSHKRSRSKSSSRHRSQSASHHKIKTSGSHRRSRSTSHRHRRSKSHGSRRSRSANDDRRSASVKIDKEKVSYRKRMRSTSKEDEITLKGNMKYDRPSTDTAFNQSRLRSQSVTPPKTTRSKSNDLQKRAKLRDRSRSNSENRNLESKRKQITPPKTSSKIKVTEPNTSKKRSHSRSSSPISKRSRTIKHPSSPSSMTQRKEENLSDFESKLRCKFGPLLFEEYASSLEERKQAFSEEFEIYKTVPELHPSYEKFYEMFVDKYIETYGNDDEKHKENVWTVFWQSNYETFKIQDWKTRRLKLIMEFEQRGTLLYVPSTSANKRHSSREEEQGLPFVFDDALSLIEKLCDKIIYLGPSVKTMIKMYRDSGINSKKAYKLFTESGNVALLNLAQDKFKSLSESAEDGDLRFLFDKAAEWIPLILQEAKGQVLQAEPNILNDVSIDINAVARISLGKGTEFTLNLIRTALTYEGVENPSTELVNDLFMRVCSIHCKLI